MKATLLAIILLAIIGCAPVTDVVKYDSIDRTPSAANQVEILTEKPDRPYKIIARIQFNPSSFSNDYQSQTDEVIKQAAAMGADAVIVSYGTQQIGYVAGNASTGVYGGTAPYKITTGEAIVYE